MFSGAWPSPLATEQLAVADDALGLGADVDEDLVLVDADDVALDDVTVLEALDVGVLLGEQLLHRRRLRAELARRGDGLGLLVGRPRRVGGVGGVEAGGIRAAVGGRRRPRRRVGGLDRRGRLDGRGARLGGRGRPRRLGLAAVSATSAAASASAGAASVIGDRRRRPARSGSFGGRPRRVGAASSSAASAGRRSSAACLDGRGFGRARPRWGRARRRGYRRRRRLLGRLGRSRRRSPRCQARSRPAALRSMVLSLLVMDLPPRITNGPSDAQAVRRRSGGSVVICSAVRSFALGGLDSRSSAVLPAGPGESSTGFSRGYNRAAVPELPDLTVVAEAFDAALAGRPIGPRRRPGPLAVRGTPAELDALVGQRVDGIRRRGKFLLIDLDRDRVVVNPMLTGRFQLAAPGASSRPRPRSSWASGRGRAAPREAAAAWTRGAAWLPADDGASRGPLPRPDPDGQGLSPAGGRRPGGARARRGRDRARTPTTRR